MLHSLTGNIDTDICVLDKLNLFDLLSLYHTNSYFRSLFTTAEHYKTKFVVDCKAWPKTECPLHAAIMTKLSFKDMTSLAIESQTNSYLRNIISNDDFIFSFVININCSKASGTSPKGAGKTEVFSGNLNVKTSFNKILFYYTLTLDHLNALKFAAEINRRRLLQNALRSVSYIAHGLLTDKGERYSRLDLTIVMKTQYYKLISHSQRIILNMIPYNTNLLYPPVENIYNTQVL
jgi:hypothetical protein